MGWTVRGTDPGRDSFFSKTSRTTVRGTAVDVILGWSFGSQFDTWVNGILWGL